MKNVFKLWINQQLRYNPYFFYRLKSVQQEQNTNPTDIEHIRNERFLRLFRRAYRKSPFYRQLYNQAGVNAAQIQSVADINQLPIITKEHLRDHLDEMFVGSQLTCSRSYTSGSSGSPLRVYRDYPSMVSEWAYQWRQRISFGHKPGDKTVVLRGDLRRDQLKLYDPFSRSLYLSSYHLRPERASWYYHAIRDFAPRAIYSYPSAAESLVNLLQEIGKSLAVPLVFTSSETLYDHQRTKIEETLNCQVVDWYGNAERNVALAQTVDKDYRELPLYSIQEYHDHFVVGTSLINESLPLIRYRVDDVIRPDERRSDRLGFRRVRSIQGRQDDVLILPDGSRISMIWGAFDRIPHLYRAQIVQEHLDAFQLNLVVCSDFGSFEEAQLRKKLAEFVGESANYTLSYVEEDQIIKAPSGKYKLIVNHLPSAQRAVSVATVS